MSTILLVDIVMAEKKNPKKIKKVTEIEDAKVTIEVEATEDEVKEAKEAAQEETETTEEVQETSEEIVENKEPEIENFDEENSRFSWSKVFLFIVIAAVTGLLIVGAYLFFIEDYNFTLTKEEPKNEISNEEETTPTPTSEEIDKSAHEITVLNGSGIAGEAASVQTLLEDEGFSVSEIGNAETADFTKTQILYTEDVNQDYLDALEKTLKTRGPVETSEADSDQTEDVVVIVGSDTSEANATPTPELE